MSIDIGLVIQYNLLKGFGFIRHGFRDQVFFHVTNWNSDTPPRRGMKVRYSLAPAQKPGFPDQAVNITPVEALTPPVVGDTSNNGGSRQ